MKRYGITARASSVIALLCASTLWAGEIHVSKKGDYRGDGTSGAPFATIARGQKAAGEKIAAGADEDIKVIIHGGTYCLDEPLVFTPDDGGGENSP